MTAHEIGEAVLYAWKNHHKRNSFETKDFVLPFIMCMEDIDWEEFVVNGIIYRRYWDRKGWIYNSETLLAWVRNGCSLPPPEVEKAEKKRIPNYRAGETE